MKVLNKESGQPGFVIVDLDSSKIHPSSPTVLNLQFQHSMNGGPDSFPADSPGKMGKIIEEYFKKRD